MQTQRNIPCAHCILFCRKPRQFKSGMLTSSTGHMRIRLKVPNWSAPDHSLSAEEYVNWMNKAKWIDLCALKWKIPVGTDCSPWSRRCLLCCEILRIHRGMDALRLGYAQLRYFTGKHTQYTCMTYADRTHTNGRFWERIVGVAHTQMYM